MSQRFARTPREWLEQQLEELNGLRNAGARSPEFKTWRQGTLTVIQRIWPGDATRSERFRRVPFSAPSSRAEAREAREYFERGCAEAMAYLRQLRDEVGDSAAGELTQTAPDSFDPGTKEDDFPTLELPAHGGVAEPPAAAAPPPPVVSEMEPSPLVVREVAPPSPIAREIAPPSPIVLESESLLIEHHIAPPPVARTAPEPAPEIEPPAGQREVVLPPASPPTPREAEARASTPPTTSIPRLPMEGPRVPPATVPSAQDAPPVAPPALSAPPERPAEGRTKAAKGMKKNGVKARLKDLLGLNETLLQGASIQPEPPASAPAPPAPAPQTAEPVAEAPPAQPLSAPALAPQAEPYEIADRTTADFLDASPVLSSRPRPAPSRNPRAAVPAMPHTSPLAMEIQALADVVAELGVPEGQRARARAALLDLARQINSNELSWVVLREAVAFLMEYPRLARRVLPILLPCFDEAA